MYIYICICMYVNICIYIYMCVYIYICKILLVSKNQRVLNKLSKDTQRYICWIVYQ